jgi:hypothetical protein
MYFPKTQITPNLYSNGNLVYDSTKLPYTGYYFEVSDGRCFTGKEPNESTNLLLIKPKSDEVDIEYQDTYNPIVIPQDFRFIAGENSTYSNLTNKSTKYSAYTPIPYTPKLTRIEIENGQFIRYFVKKSNENIYTEINKNGYSLATNSKLYYKFSFSWIIKGIPEEVIKQNASQILLQEKNRKIIGLNKFLRFNYLQFYQE